MRGLKKKVFDLLIKNRRIKGKYQYTVPSPDSYPYQWFWDSCFHAIILSHFNLEDAKKELLSLVSKQFDNGMIPHMIMWEKNPPNNHFKGVTISWGKKDTSSITQPPMIAYATWQIYLKDRKKDFLIKIYPSLEKFYRYFLNDRDPRNNHLASIINPDESGEDNSPRFDIALGLPPNNNQDENFKKRVELINKNRDECNFDAPFCMKNFFWVKDVPINAILVENLKILSNIASEVGNDFDADFFFYQSRMVADAMRKMMLEDKVFWPLYFVDGKYQKIKVKTWAIFAPLFAGIATKEEADYVIKDYLLNQEEFNLSYFISTVSKEEASFDPRGFWRGPVWISTNWFVFIGLKKYGYFALADKILESSVSLIEKSGFREQFDPLTGEGLGAKNFTWGGLVVDILESKALVEKEPYNKSVHIHQPYF